MPQSDRSNSIWPNDIIITWHSWLVLSCIGSNELAAQHSNIWLVLAIAVCSVLQKPSTFPSSTCIDLLRGDSCMLYGGYFMCVICAAAVFLTCSQQHVVDVFQQQQRCRSITPKTRYINIVMYITMPIPPRVVMTEIDLDTFTVKALHWIAHGNSY